MTTQQQLDVAIAEARSEPAAYVVGPADGSYLYKGCARNLAARRDHRMGSMGVMGVMEIRPVLRGVRPILPMLPIPPQVAPQIPA